MSRRTSIVVMTNEARVLKQLREKAGLSMREAAAQIGVSSSLISQIENGRENFPKGERLVRFLRIYGLAEDKFRKLVDRFSAELTDLEVLQALLPRLSDKDIRTVRIIAEQFASNLPSRK